MNPEIKAALEQVRKALSHPTREYRPADAAFDLITAHLERQEARVREMEALQDRLVDLWQGPIRDSLLRKLNATEASVFNDIGALVCASVEARQKAQMKELLKSIITGAPHE